jgi:TIR domain
MHFDADAFISYAHLDNQELVEGRKGWVANLHRALQIRLGMFLGKEPQIWRDPKLQGNDVFAETLVDRLRRVAVLIAVVSPRYVKSDWARKELSEFCKAAAQQGGIHVHQKARIFKVLKTPVPVPAHPPELQSLLGYEFFQVDPETGKVRELDEVFGESAQRDFWMRLDDLAHEICALLEEIEPLTADEFPSAPPGRETVFLAETTSDLREQRALIKRDLQQQGYIVLPAQPLPDVADDVKAAVHSDLVDCRMSIHLFGGNYGLVPEGGVQSLLELQNEVAMERAQAGGFCRLLWIPPNVKVVDDRQAAVLEHLRNDPRLEQGADLLETFLEDFRTLIQVRLDAARKPPQVEPAAADLVRASPVDVHRVYLIYDGRDADLAAQWGDFLFDQKIEVLYPLFEGDEAEVREDHEDNLRTCDGVLVLYGAANEVWLRRKLRELQKSAGYGRTKPAATVAICVLPPNTPEKGRLRTHDAMVIRPSGDFSPEPLIPFLSRLRHPPRSDA